jgi:hypothetical protein
MVDTLEELAPTLRLTGDRSASRSEVTTLIQLLLDEEAVRESWRRAMFVERYSYLDTVESVIRSGRTFLGVGGPAAFARLAAPAFRLDATGVLDMNDALLKAGMAPTYPAAAELIPTYPSYDTAFDRHTHFLSRILVPSLDRAAELTFMALAERRLAATALAIRLYELDHGARPATLHALVPDYLEFVPADPFAADGREIGYLPDAVHPKLYSIGYDAEDQGGRIDRQGRQRPPDIVFFISSDRPRRPYVMPDLDEDGSPDAVNEDGEPEGEQRQGEQEEQPSPESQPRPDQPDAEP